MLETTQHQDIVIKLRLTFDVPINLSLLVDDIVVKTVLNSKDIDFGHDITGISAGEHSFTYVVTPDIVPILNNFTIFKYDRLTWKPSIPVTVNSEQLGEEFIAAGLPVTLAGTVNELLYHTVVDANIPAIQAVIDAHNPNVLTDSQQLSEDNQITKMQIKEYLRSQLLSASPNPATIKTTIQSAVGANVNVSQAIENMATIKNYDTATNLGYIASCIDLVAILL